VPAVTALWTDHDPVFDVGDARRRPRHALGFLAFDPRANGTFQDHLAAICLDGDPVSVHLGISLECFYDLALKLRRFHLGLHRDDVGDPLDALHLSHRVFGGGLLVLPLHRAFQGDPAVLDDDLDLFMRNRQLRLQGRDSISRDIGIGTLIDRRRPELDIIWRRPELRRPASPRVRLPVYRCSS
jgi:hypothetical protein